MIESGNFIEEKGRFLVEAYAQKQVRVYAGQEGLRLTEIDLNGKTITIARDPNPSFYPKIYGEIILPSESKIPRLSITKLPLEGLARFMIFDGDDPVGAAVGNRFDLALAEGLGITDKYLAQYASRTIVVPQIPEKIVAAILHN